MSSHRALCLVRAKNGHWTKGFMAWQGPGGIQRIAHVWIGLRMHPLNTIRGGKNMEGNTGSAGDTVGGRLLSERLRVMKSAPCSGPQERKALILYSDSMIKPLLHAVQRKSIRVQNKHTLRKRETKGCS